jgi:predicted GIY-YIG superfamily endonuclease
VKLVYFKEFENKSEASKEEYRIKQLKKSDKKLLINKNKNK